MSLTTRLQESAGFAELYLTVTPSKKCSPQEQAREVYNQVQAALSSSGTRIFQERIFAAPEAMPLVLSVRQEILGSLADALPPTCLAVPIEQYGPLVGVHIHAVRSPQPIKPLRSKGIVRGRLIEGSDCKWVYLGGLQGNASDPPAAQAAVALDIAAECLATLGATFLDVARTWWFMDKICSWYASFNQARNRFFNAQGLIVNGQPQHLPASTGIGIAPYGPQACALDVLAVLDGRKSYQPIMTGGIQGSAYSYGSAFARAATVRMPASKALFISGTASLRDNGEVLHIGDIPAQFHEVVTQIRALLAQAGYREEDVVQTAVYCKTPAVEKVYPAAWKNVIWPPLPILGDVCREEWLVEIEALAAKPL